MDRNGFGGIMFRGGPGGGPGFGGGPGGGPGFGGGPGHGPGGGPGFGGGPGPHFHGGFFRPHRPWPRRPMGCGCLPFALMAIAFVVMVLILI